MDEIDARLATLTARFVVQAEELAIVIEACLVRGAWDELMMPCHSLAGRAGMFGHAAIGDAARAVEEAVAAGASPDEIRRLAAGLLDRLRSLRQER